MALVLTRKDVEELLTMKEAMSAVEEAFRQYSLGKVIMPLRTTIHIAEYKGVNLAMPAYVGGDLNALGLKVVSVYGNNPEKYEREQSKKYAPVRGEKTPMPPRGDKRREDFEKWYAAQRR